LLPKQCAWTAALGSLRCARVAWWPSQARTCPIGYSFNIMAYVDPLTFIRELYQAKGFDLSVCTYWTGVAQGTYQAGSYSHNGAFALVKGSTEPMMLIASNLESEVAAPLNTILQHYF
jgi:hypothetical protein